MEIGESAFTNVIVAFSLLSCFILLLSLPIRKFLGSKGWTSEKLNLIELSIRWMPIILFLFLFLKYISAHLLLDYSQVHVAFHLNSESTILHRLASIFVGYDGATLMLMGVIVITHLILSKVIKIRDKDMVDRWFSLLWILCLTGILPEQTFEILIDGTFVPLSEELLFNSAKEGALSAFIFGTLLGIGPHAMEFDSKLQTRKNILFILALLGMFSILFGPLETLTPLANNIWDVTLFSELEIMRMTTIVSTLMLFCFAPILIYYSEILDDKIPAGKNRWISLASSIIFGIICLVLSSIILLYPEWSYASIFNELLTELFPILIFGLIFSLLPILGLDDRSRPELHGWRYGLFVGVPLSCLNSSLISLSLLVGWLIALLFTLTLPLIIESSPLLTFKIKSVNLVSSLISIILVIILIHNYPNLNIVLPIMGICCILLMEINNMQLSGMYNQLQESQ